MKREELDTLLELLGITTEHEINCEELLAALPSYLERVRDKKPLAHEHAIVLRHLRICLECREEFDGLLDAIDDEVL